MPKFSDYFSLGLTQHQLDFVDIDPDKDTPVYVDPYAIEIRNDVWSNNASDYIRSFFLEVLNAITQNDYALAEKLMAHLHEPRETFLGVSKGKPKGRGIGRFQAKKLVESIAKSKAYNTGILSDLSEMGLYIENVDRDKISDLTTNIIRKLLVEYTEEQCNLYGLPTSQYASPPMWDNDNKRWKSRYVNLPYINGEAIILVPKYIVRRRLSLDSQEFYNKQITDFLVEEHINAMSSLVEVVTNKSGIKKIKIRKTDVREKHPKSKSYIAEIVNEHPELLELFKKIAKKHGVLTKFSDTEDVPSINTVCLSLAEELKSIPTGNKSATEYHQLVFGALTALFYPELILPKKEWEVNDGRKRIDIVFTNSADSGFFSHRRDDNSEANFVVVECKNYSDDIENPEFDQMLGRFDNNRGKFGIITCRTIENSSKVIKRCKDAASSGRGFVIVLSDENLIEMLNAKANLNDDLIYRSLNKKYRDILS